MIPERRRYDDLYAGSMTLNRKHDGLDAGGGKDRLIDQQLSDELELTDKN